MEQLAAKWIRRAGPWCVLVVVLASGPAWAHPEVTAARDAFLEGDFRTALTRLESAERSPAAREEDRVNIHWYRALSFHALGRPDEAERAIDALIEMRPMFSPDRSEAPPNFREVFKRRAAAWHEAHGVDPSEPSFNDTTVTVRLTGHSESATRVVLFARPPDAAEFQPFELRRDGEDAKGVIDQMGLWAAAGDLGRMEMVIEVYNEAGMLLARRGDALHPIVVSVSPEQSAAAIEMLRKSATLPSSPPRAKPQEPALPEVTTAPESVRDDERPAGAWRYLSNVTPWMATAAPMLVASGCTLLTFCGTSTGCVCTSLFAIGGGNNFLSEMVFPSMVATTMLCGTSTVSCCVANTFGGLTALLGLVEMYYMSPRSPRRRGSSAGRFEEDEAVPEEAPPPAVTAEPPPDSNETVVW